MSPNQFDIKQAVLNQFAKKLRREAEQIDPATLEPHLDREVIARFTRSGVGRELVLDHVLRCYRCSQLVKASFRHQRNQRIADTYGVLVQTVEHLLESRPFSMHLVGKERVFDSGHSKQFASAFEIANGPVALSVGEAAPDNSVDRWAKTEQGEFDGTNVQWNLQTGFNGTRTVERKLVIETEDRDWFDQIARVELAEENAVPIPVFVALHSHLKSAYGSMRIGDSSGSVSLNSTVRKVDPQILSVEEAEDDRDYILVSQRLARDFDPNSVTVWDKWQARLSEAVRAVVPAISEAISPSLAVLSELLKGLVQTEDGGLRWSAVAALGELGAGAATEPVISTLLSALTQMEDDDLSRAAAAALGNLGPAAATELVLSALLAALTQSAHRDLRLTAAEALGYMGSGAVNEQVLNALQSAVTQSEDQQLRAKAAEALTLINGTA